jgi:hypothetical protein
VSTRFDREHPSHRHPYADDTTAEIPIPTINDPHDPDRDRAPTQQGGRRHTTHRRRTPAALLLAYTLASLGSLWLLFLAFLRLNLPIMLVMTGALVWFVPDTVRLARWLPHPDQSDANRQCPRLSLLQRLVVSVLAVVYLYLLTDWWLHP